MKSPYRHPALERFDRNQREEIWHAYREKYPDMKWSLAFFGVWLVWAFGWMIAASWLHLYLDQESILRFFAPIMLFLVMGFFGGVIFAGSFMLPKRIRACHEYLDRQDDASLSADLGLKG